VFVISVNGKDYSVDAEADTPLLWVIRDSIGLTGTKYGCGIGLCGACTVHIDGVMTRSCQISLGDAAGTKVTTIEGLSANATHPVQIAWLEHTVPQCGFCQSGQIMAAAALLSGNPEPTDRDIDDAMVGNLCRCGTYLQIRAAIHDAARIMRSKTKPGTTA
jgi:aerobic-type carbon monoxide dehydrogenase small subunit (CoxS/CutS family)